MKKEGGILLAILSQRWMAKGPYQKKLFPLINKIKMKGE
jgi:hypothetical protein